MTDQRVEDLMDGQSMPVQIAHEVLLDMRELGVRVMDGKAIRNLMTAKMEGQELYLVGKTFGRALKEAGWWTDKPYDRSTESKSAAWFTSPVTLGEAPPSKVGAMIRADSSKLAGKF